MHSLLLLQEGPPVYNPDMLHPWQFVLWCGIFMLGLSIGWFVRHLFGDEPKGRRVLDAVFAIVIFIAIIIVVAVATVFTG